MHGHTRHTTLLADYDHATRATSNAVPSGTIEEQGLLTSFEHYVSYMLKRAVCVTAAAHAFGLTTRIVFVDQLPREVTSLCCRHR